MIDSKKFNRLCHAFKVATNEEILYRKYPLDKTSTEELKNNRRQVLSKLVECFSMWDENADCLPSIIPIGTLNNIAVIKLVDSIEEAEKLLNLDIKKVK